MRLLFVIGNWDSFSLSRFDVYFILIFVTFVVLLILDKLPTVEGFRKLVSTLDDKGGNIGLLASFSSWFFSVAIGMFYYAYQMIADKKIDGKDAIMLMGLTFATGTAFGGSFGAMLKTMTGNLTVAPPNPAGTGVPMTPHIDVVTTSPGPSTSSTTVSAETTIPPKETT